MEVVQLDLRDGEGVEADLGHGVVVGLYLSQFIYKAFQDGIQIIKFWMFFKMPNQLQGYCACGFGVLA